MATFKAKWLTITHDVDRVDLMFPVGGGLASFLRERKSAQSSARSTMKSLDGVNPFKHVYGMSMFEYFEKDNEHKTAFDLWMSGRRSGTKCEWFETYPVKSQLFAGATSGKDDSVLVVDVAGGKGHDIASLRAHFPETPGRLILQDLPRTLENAVTPDGVERMPFDLFSDQPVRGWYSLTAMTFVELQTDSSIGARAYFFRAIFHDWSDADCRSILTHTARAMEPGYSKLLIEDLVLPEAGASLREAAVDVLMFMMPGGIERTISDWAKLLESVGLRIVKVWADRDRSEPVIEAELNIV